MAQQQRPLLPFFLLQNFFQRELFRPIQQRFRCSHCQRCFLGDHLRKGQRLIQQLIPGIDPVDKAQLLALLCRHRSCSKHQLLGQMPPHSLFQQIVTAAVRCDAHVDKGLDKLCFLRCKDHIAGQCQVKACTGSRTVHHGNGGRFHTEQRFHGLIGHPHILIALFLRITVHQHPKVAACAESPA